MQIRLCIFLSCFSEISSNHNKPTIIHPGYTLTVPFLSLSMSYCFYKPARMMQPRQQASIQVSKHATKHDGQAGWKARVRRWKAGVSPFISLKAKCHIGLTRMSACRPYTFLSLSIDIHTAPFIYLSIYLSICVFERSLLLYVNRDRTDYYGQGAPDGRLHTAPEL